MKGIFYKTTGFTLLLVFIVNILNAQQDFITAVPEPAQLSSVQKSMKEKIYKNSYYKNAQLVEIGSLPHIQKNGSLTFSIPGRQGAIVATAVNVKATSDEDFTWTGSIQESTGSMSVISKNGKITANISIGEEIYEIYHTDDDKHYLVLLDKEKAAKSNYCGTISGRNTSKKNDSGNQPNSESTLTSLSVGECLDYVRVLVLFTPRVAAAVADVNQLINLCISQFHTTIYNSGITSRTVIEEAGRQQLNFIESSINGDLERLISDASAQTARNNTQADIVVLLTHGDYGGNYGIAGAVSEPNNERSYAIVQAGQATNSNRTFVHEVGHLYGCKHDNDMISGGSPYAYGYTFKRNFLSPRYATIMCHGDAPGTRLLNFSNPSIYVDGTPTGTITKNNNARRVSETYSTVMGFRPSFRRFSALISGPEYGAAYRQYTWEARVSCGAAPYTFEWRTSDDGFNFSPVRGTGETFTDHLTCPPGTTYFIRLTARSSDGQVSTYTHTVTIDKSVCTYYVSNKNVQLPTEKLLDEKNKITISDVYPIPATSSFRIEIKNQIPVDLTISLLNQTGQNIKTIISRKNLAAGSHIETITSGTYSAGIYFLKIKLGNHIETRKLIIHRAP